jgi:hypothetical protein
MMREERNVVVVIGSNISTQAEGGHVVVQFLVAHPLRKGM